MISADRLVGSTGLVGRSLVPGWHVGFRWAVRWAGLTLTATVLGVAVSSASLLRAAIAVPVAALLIALSLLAPRRAVVILFVWLAVFGTIRRLVLAGAPGESDPILLVAPAVAGMLVVVAAHRGAFRSLTRFSRSVLVLCAVVMLAALNPLQGSLVVGVGGLLFVFVPLLWFWIGRGLVDRRLLSRVLRVVSYLSLGAAAYGLFQVYIGLPPWDQRWVETKGYAALGVGESIRPFASFSSAAEYVGLLAIGIVLWSLRLGRARRVLPVSCALALLVWALTVASVRGALVLVPVALGMTFAASRGFGMARTVLAGVSALFLLGVAVTQVDPSAVGDNQASELVSRQLTGLADPFDSEASTLPLHLGALLGGLQDGLRNPLGRGLGVITIAGQKFGSVNLSTDVDPSNVAVAMGLPGLLAYAVVVILGLRLAFQEARRRRDLLVLAGLGIALVTLFQWLAGGHYAIAPLPWLLLGWLDRQSVQTDERRPTPELP